MSRRARIRLLARELKRADAYLGPEPDEDDDEGSRPDAWADTDGDDGADFRSLAADPYLQPVRIDP